MSDDDLAYVLRCQSKRTDIPIDVVRTLSEAYAEIISLRQLLGNTEELRRERDELRQQVENIKNGFEGGCYLCEVVGEMNKRLQKERDAALAVVNEFVSDTTTNNETPDHECEFSHSPETGKCDACEAWGDYVLICHPLWETDEEETL